LVKHDDNVTILLNGKNTLDPPCNIQLTHLSEPKSIEILYKNIRSSVHVISTFFGKPLKRINFLQGNMIAFLTLTLSSLMESIKVLP
jgi:hypothetical protein